MLTAMNPVNVPVKCDLVKDHWSPKIIAELNGQEVKLAKFKGEFVWHSHEVDELFFVLKGSFELHLRDRVLAVNEGEMIVVPAGVEHKPVADQEVTVMLFEPSGVVNTGDAGGNLTQEAEWI